MFEAVALESGATQAHELLRAAQVLLRVVKSQDQPLPVGIEDLEPLEVGEDRPADFFLARVFKGLLLLRRAVAAPLSGFGDQIEAFDFNKEPRLPVDKQADVRVARFADITLAIVLEGAEDVPAQSSKELVNEISADVCLRARFVFVTIIALNEFGYFLARVRHERI